MLDGLRGAEGVLEGDAFGELDAAQEFFEGDVALFVGGRMDDVFSSVEKKIAGAFSIAGISQFIKKMYEVRSQFQDVETSFAVFLKDAEKAKSFVKELQDYAWYNMFEFSDLTQQSSQLLAYGLSLG